MKHRGGHIKFETHLYIYVYYITDFMQMFFSSCPEKYVWFLRCIKWVAGDKDCPVTNIYVGLLLTSIKRTTVIPWEAITRDLKQTGLSFESPELKFSIFTYGKNGKHITKV